MVQLDLLVDGTLKILEFRWPVLACEGLIEAENSVSQQIELA